MQIFIKFRKIFISWISIFFISLLLNSFVFANPPNHVAILTYHNFDPNIPGSMTVTPKQFEQQLVWLKEHGYTVIPLQELVSYLQGKPANIPEKSVVITADDGRKSVYQYMLPLARKYQIPVTLFIYPIAISNASYALTWEQLKELKQTGLFDIQGHTYWHPNFIEEKRKLSSAEYQKFVKVQLVNSKKKIEEKLNTSISFLAWPYGIYDKFLEQQAAKAGYVMAFSVDDRSSKKSENSMAQPRYTVKAGHSLKTFSRMVGPGF